MFLQRFLKNLEIPTAHRSKLRRSLCIIYRYTVGTKQYQNNSQSVKRVHAQNSPESSDVSSPLALSDLQWGNVSDRIRPDLLLGQKHVAITPSLNPPATLPSALGAIIFDVQVLASIRVA